VREALCEHMGRGWDVSTHCKAQGTGNEHPHGRKVQNVNTNGPNGNWMQACIKVTSLNAWRGSFGICEGKRGVGKKGGKRKSMEKFGEEPGNEM